ncbi:MAG: NTP transferase domain-containing protein [Leptospirales bacterium]|nr:NTP transferase domain-containing protein [Leptospirales bacterium]
MNQVEQLPAAVVLAAGKGTRMRSEHPKVAAVLGGRALINHVISNLAAAGVGRQVIIVGYRQEEVRALAKLNAGLQLDFAVQAEQHGTGHAFLCAREALQTFQGPTLCTAGDMPMIRPQSFQALLDFHRREGNAVSALSAQLDNPAGYGRIVRDSKGALLRNVEEKDASEEIRRIREVNTGVYVFNAPAIFDLIQQIGKSNAQNEYYLPDAIAVARQQGQKVGALQLEDSSEAQGVNSPEELAALESRLAARAG